MSRNPDFNSTRCLGQAGIGIGPSACRPSAMYPVSAIHDEPGRNRDLHNPCTQTTTTGCNRLEPPTIRAGRPPDRVVELGITERHSRRCAARSAGGCNCTQSYQGQPRWCSLTRAHSQTYKPIEIRSALFNAQADLGLLAEEWLAEWEFLEWAQIKRRLARSSGTDCRIPGKSRSEGRTGASSRRRRNSGLDSARPHSRCRCGTAAKGNSGANSGTTDMARAGIEPATPRFSVVCSTN